METMHEDEHKSVNKDLNTPTKLVSSEPSYSIQANNQFNPQGVYDQLNQMFIEQDQQHIAVKEARGILGETAEDLTDGQVFELVNEVQFLVDTWLEEFEKKVFEGKTLNETLNLER